MDSGDLRSRAATKNTKDDEGDDDEPMPMQKMNAIRAKKPRRQGYIVADCPGCNRFRCRAVLVTFLMSLPTYWACYSMPQILRGLGIGMNEPLYWFHRLISFWLVLSLFTNFQQCMFRDPGYLSTNPVHADDEDGRFALPQMKELKDVDRLYYSARFCQWCKGWKPPRSHHCSTVDHCVMRMDHFCPFTNTCIGAFNHGNFLLIYFFGYTALFYSAVISACSLHVILNDPAYDKVAQSPGFLGNVPVIWAYLQSSNLEMVGLQIVGSVIWFLPTYVYGEDTRQGAAIGTTTIERRLHDFGEEVELPGAAGRVVKVGGGFYNEGYAKNHYVLLGRYWFMRLFGCNLRFAPILPEATTHPVPSKMTAKAIKKRIQETSS